MNWAKKVFICFSLFLVPFMTSANTGLRLPEVPCSQVWESKRNECKKDWTLLVYMMVTEDMEPYSIADRLEMELPHAGSSLRADVIVQVSHLKTQEIQRFH